MFIIDFGILQECTIEGDLEEHGSMQSNELLIHLEDLRWTFHLEVRLDSKGYGRC